MSELKNCIRSLIRIASDCDADQASIEMDFGKWRSSLSGQRKSCVCQEGGVA